VSHASKAAGKRLAESKRARSTQTPAREAVEQALEELAADAEADELDALEA
jgi:hypothetical protein